MFIVSGYCVVVSSVHVAYRLCYRWFVSEPVCVCSPYPPGDMHLPPVIHPEWLTPWPRADQAPAPSPCAVTGRTHAVEHVFQQFRLFQTLARDSPVSLHKRNRAACLSDLVSPGCGGSCGRVSWPPPYTPTGGQTQSSLQPPGTHTHTHTYTQTHTNKYTHTHTHMIHIHQIHT